MLRTSLIVMTLFVAGIASPGCSSADGGPVAGAVDSSGWVSDAGVRTGEPPSGSGSAQDAWQQPTVDGVGTTQPDASTRAVTDTSSGPTPDATTQPGPVNSSGSATSLSCVDGQYTETLPTPEVSIDAEVASYTPAGYMTFIDAVLAKRYPVGGYLITNALEDQSWGHCVDVFLHQKNTADQVIGSMSTLVHECGHFLDGSTGGFFDDAYVITDTLTLTCSGGSTPDNGGGKTFSRSLIKADPYSELWPPCASFGAGGACDSYAPIYLDGDPNDANFDSGDQGFGSLLEETVQYVNSLATGYAFNDYYGWGTSERDGILTFLWYVQRYLRLARLEHPTAYNHLLDSSCWRNAILTVWGRAWMFLVLTEEYSQLGIDDDILEPLALAAELNEEIQLVREAHGCP